MVHCALRVECGGCCHFAGYWYSPYLATVKEYWANYCLVDPALCTPRYFTPPPKTGLQARECGTRKINPVSYLLAALAVCEDYRTEVLKFDHILQGLTIKQDSLELERGTLVECPKFNQNNRPSLFVGSVAGLCLPDRLSPCRSAALHESLTC